VLHENRLETLNIDELDALEDEEDADFLNSYREKRLNELSTLQSTSIYNQVYHLQKPDYATDVTEASNKSFVFVLLTSSAGMNLESNLMVQIWREMATRFGDVKFCQMQAGLCIESYPDKNTPTVLIYRNGDIKRQIVTLKDLKGEKTTLAEWEMILIAVGAVKFDDPRISRRNDETEKPKKNGVRNKSNEDSDSDWD